jgi:hypothetical protein
MPDLDQIKEVEQGVRVRAGGIPPSALADRRNA